VVHLRQPLPRRLAKAHDDILANARAQGIDGDNMRDLEGRAVPQVGPDD
jgi:hypothetical protein